MQLGLAQPRQAATRALTDKIALAVGATVLSLYLAFGGMVAVNIHNGLDPAGSPLFYDFSAFYQAAALADAGQPGVAYDDKAMIAAEQAAFPGTTRRLPWNYPPTFQLMLTPLGLLPYVAAGIVWCAGLFGLYALLARRLVSTERLWLLLLFPGAAINLLVGQNGLLSTVLIGGGVLLLARRPLVGGALLGLMAYKPHFAVLIPFVLIAGREWRGFAGAALSGAGLALLSAAVFGLDPWIAFIHKAAAPAAIYSSSSSSWLGVPSVMIMARSLGLDAGLAAALHWAVAAVAAIGAMWAWRKTEDPRLRAGVLAAATVVVSPYLRSYDLALLILPIAALLPGLARRSPIEAVILAAAWLLPAVLLFIPMTVQLGPIAILAVLALVLWRVAHDGGSSRTAEPSGVSQAMPSPAA